MREMKDSGVEWIGKIPEEWTKDKAIRLFNIIGSGTTPKNITSDFPCVNWIQSGGINGSLISSCKNNVSESIISQYSALKIYAAPFIVIAMYGASVGNTSISLIDGCVNQACCVLSASIYNLNYAFYAIKSSQNYLIRKAIGGGQPNISQDTIKQLWLPLPTLHEQERIAAFLDAECAEIDAVLEKTRASIEEYKKLKQAVITQAVTKGIRGDRPMKNSGIEWIGEIAAGVPISRVGLHFDIVLGKMLCSAPVDDNYTLESYYCAADVHFEGLSNGEKKKMWFSPDEKEQYCVKNGDLLVVEGGAGAGGCAIAVSTDVPIYIQNSIMIVRSKGISNIRYLRYLLECLVKKGYIDVVCNKATIPHFTKDKLANVPFIVFSQSEQEEIAEYLNEKCAGIDALIAKKQQYLTEIETYKKSLIYEYVTGKKEVHPL